MLWSDQQQLNCSKMIWRSDYVEQCINHCVKFCREITNVVLTLCDVEVREWISNFIPHYTTSVITYPCCLVTHKDPVILQSQYHACWFSGDTRSQGFSSLLIDWVLPECFLLQYQKDYDNVMLCFIYKEKTSYRWLRARLQYLHC